MAHERGWTWPEFFVGALVLLLILVPLLIHFHTAVW